MASNPDHPGDVATHFANHDRVRALNQNVQHARGMDSRGKKDAASGLTSMFDQPYDIC